MADSEHCDVAIVGGGLAGGLIAHALATRRPELTVRLVEPGAIGGDHVWSFFTDDVAAADRPLIEPFVAHRWDGYDITFPRRRRTLGASYNSVTSDRFAAVLAERIGPGRIVRGAAAAVSPTEVLLEDGRRIAAGGVIDARGPGDLALTRPGWQKFVGRELRLTRPHGLVRPVVMDGAVEQHDGFRFVYLLPFAPDRLLVEDTYYSNGPLLDVTAVIARIGAYARARGWQVAAVEREETGVLPIATGGDFAAYWRSTGEGIAKAGMRAGLFHPTTGYSLPDAVATAALVAGARDLSGPALHRLLRDHAATCWRERGFYRMLARMLFHAADPPHRYRVLERFYTLDEALVGRFYAGRSTALDKLRVLVGRPPVPIGRAIAALTERTA